MPVTSANTLLFDGPSLGIQHGIYLKTLRLKPVTSAISDAHQYVILWFPENTGIYPLLSDVTGGRMEVSPNGGARMDLDTEVATFGLYELQAKTPTLKAWVDFDHWPMEGMSIKNGLANGHFHKGPRWGDQHPMTDVYRTLLMKVVTMIRGGVVS